MGILDQDVDDRVSLAVPQLYRRGIERKEWTQLKFWVYMIDGLYQSVLCFYFAYLVFEPGNFVTEDGRNINDYKRLGVYIGTPAVVVVNIYMMMNVFRWDWFMCLISSISALLIFLWTGVYTSFTAGFTFYGAGSQVFGSLSFWATLLLIVILCLLPRFAAKSIQKIYFPRDVDIIREQIRHGKFDYLKAVDPGNVPVASTDKLGGASSTSSSELSKPDQAKGHQRGANSKMSDDMRPIYPPSVAPTATTHNPRSHNGSDGTDYTGHRSSIDRAFPMAPESHRHSTASPMTPTISEPLDAPRYSHERPRPSFDRLRSSMDRTRPSFEASRDFTSAAYLARVESSNSQGRSASHSRAPSVAPSVSASRRHDISNDIGQL